MTTDTCFDSGCNGCDECTDYECSCTDYLRPECDGVGCAAERANEKGAPPTAPEGAEKP